MPTLFDLYGIDLGQPDEPPPPKSGLIRRAVGDTAVTAVKSAIGLPEFAVGLADLATGGGAGKALENEGGTVGFRPKQTREYLDTLYSPEQQAANREVQQAQGFWDTASAAIRNPSTIGHAVVESAPSLLPAAGIARGVMAGAQRLSPTLAGRIAAAEAAPLVASQGAKTAAELTRLAAIGIGEGVVSAGASAEQIRQQTDDGRLTGEQSLIVAGSSALTGLIVGVAGKIANKLGIGDVQQMLAGVQQAGPKAEKALTRALLEGFATEGILQELPQSAQEQIAQNVALGKPWDEGVGNAAAMGTLAGGVMGVGGAAIGRLRPQPAPVDPLAEGNARADAAMERLATTNDVGQMIDAAREIATATPLQPLAISPEQEASVMQAGEELAQADLTDMKNMGRLDKTPSRGVEQFAPIVPASEEGPAPFLDRLLTATEALQDPAVRQRVEQAAGPQYLAQLDQYAEVANTPGFMDGIGDQVRDRHLELLERAVFPERFRKPAPQIQRAERRRSDPVPIEPFRAEPVTDPVLDYVDAKRAENTMAARAFVKEFEAGRITRRDVVRVMQDRNADPLGSNPDPLASIQPATPAPNLIQQRLEAAARAGQAQPTGIQIEPSRARPKGQSDERNPERAVPGEGRPVDTGNQPGTSGVVSGELQQPGAPGTTGEAVPSAVQGVDAERAGRGLGDDALKTEQPDYLTQLFGTPAQQAEAQKRFEASEGERKGQQAADAKRIREAIEAEKKRAQKELDDWSGRSYKANKTQIDLRGDGPSNQASMSIGAINESRRRNAMDALSQELRALEKIAKEVADDATAAQFVAKMRQSYQQAEGTARNGGWAGFKTADELFQYGLLDGLKFRGPSGKGNVTSNGLSRAVLQAIKGAPNGQEAQEAAQDGDSTARTGGTGRSNVAPVGSAQAQAGTPAEGAKANPQAIEKLRDAISTKKPLGIQTHGDGGVFVGASIRADDMVRLELTPAERKQLNQAQALEQLAETQAERDEARAAVQAAVAAPAARAAGATVEAEGAGGSRPTTGQANQADEIGERIGAAVDAGVELTQLDQAAIREAAGKAKELRDRANRISGRGADPMNKGNAFPMGVGFTKMTKRSEQRLDASVRRAGEAVELWKQAEQFEKQVESYLQGKGTEADKAKRAARKTETQRELVKRLVGWKKGDKIGSYAIERVNKDRDGYPASYTISGDGVIKGVMDRVDVAREFFGGDKAKLRGMVDEERSGATKPADQAAILPLDQAANEAATSPSNDLPEPTEAQQAAGNYKVGRIKVAGLDISVENPAGSERSGIDPDGKKWRNTLAHHYGYIRRSEGADGDHVDVFVNPGTPEDYDGQVFVVDQADPKTGRFDEHKVMMGFPSAKAAQEAYQANYAKDWTGLRAVQPMTMEQFKAWVSDPANTKKPAAKGVKPGKGEKVERPDELVELRKRESALKSLRECLG